MARGPRPVRPAERTAPRGHWATARVRFPAPPRIRSGLLTALNVPLRQLTEGPVGPSRGARHCWPSARPVARDPRGAAAARRAASRRMFFTNSTEIKRYEFEKTRKWEER